MKDHRTLQLVVLAALRMHDLDRYTGCRGVAALLRSAATLR